MKKALTSAIILFTMLLAVTAQADIQQHPIGLQIWVPNTWTTEIDEGLLMTSSPDEGALVILMVLESDEIEIAMDEMDKELSQIIKKIRTTSEAEEININGLNGWTEEGTGRVDGVPIEWLSGLFPYRNQALMILAFAESSNFDSYEDMLIEIFSSLQPY
jgi:hypothetical protein